MRGAGGEEGIQRWLGWGPGDACRIRSGAVALPYSMRLAGSFSPSGKGRQDGQSSPDCVPKPATERWIPTTEIQAVNRILAVHVAGKGPPEWHPALVNVPAVAEPAKITVLKYYDSRNQATLTLLPPGGSRPVGSKAASRRP